MKYPALQLVARAANGLVPVQPCFAKNDQFVDVRVQRKLTIRSGAALVGPPI
jgi:hypothetical protein